MSSVRPTSFIWTVPKGRFPSTWVAPLPRVPPPMTRTIPLGRRCRKRLSQRVVETLRGITAANRRWRPNPAPAGYWRRACGVGETLYRGEIVFGRTAAKWGRELGKRKTVNGKPREHGQVPMPEETWVRVVNEDLRIIDRDLAARCDKRLLAMRNQYLSSKAKGGRVPERAHGRYLLTGGMLICPTCGGHFEYYKAPWKDAVYLCSTRRRKPGVCTNTLMLPVAEFDDAVLGVIEGEVLGARVIEELLTLVDKGEQDDTADVTADLERLQREVNNLLELVACGEPAATVAPKIRERRVEVAKLEARLQTPRQAPPDIARLRQALTLRAAQRKADLRAEVKVARLLVRRLVGPLTLWDADQNAQSPEWVEWQAAATRALLDGLIHDVASPTGFEPVFWP